MQRIRLASVSYLNALPLTRGLTHGDGEPGFDIVLTPPAGCARLLAEGLVDVALIPSIEFARLPGLSWVPSTCVSSREEVRSVLLLSRTDPERITTLAIDTNSRTSVALARLILARRHGCAPRLVPMAPDAATMLAGHDAALLIGDPALRASLPGGAALSGRLRVLDLAHEWHELTHMPFVFALWACRPVVRVDEMSALLDWSLEVGIASIDAIAAEESSRTGLPEDLIASYLRRNISYRLGAAEAESLRLFYRLCREEGILTRAVSLDASGILTAPPAPDRPAARKR